MSAICHQPRFESLCQKRLAGMPTTSDEHNGRPVAVLLSPLFDADFPLHPGKVTATRFFAEKLLIVTDHFSHDPTASDVIIIDEDESPGRLKRRRQIERHRSLGSQRQFGHLIAMNGRAALLLIQIHRVDDPLDPRYFALHLFSGNTQNIPTAFFKRTFSQPEQVRLERSRDERQLLLMRGKLASLDENLFVERDADGLSRFSPSWNGFDVERFDRSDVRPFVRWRKHQVVANLQSTRRNAAGEDAAGIELIDILNREPQRLLRPHRFFFKEAQCIQYRGTVVPDHLFTSVRNVVSEFGTHGDDPFWHRSELS